VRAQGLENGLARFGVPLLQDDGSLSLFYTRMIGSHVARAIPVIDVDHGNAGSARVQHGQRAVMPQS
jgi:hypothetical protein